MRIFSISPKCPFSIIRSASSITKYLIWFILFKYSLPLENTIALSKLVDGWLKTVYRQTSSIICMRRPGVATIISGIFFSSLSCFICEIPPSTAAIFVDDNSLPNYFFFSLVENQRQIFYFYILISAANLEMIFYLNSQFACRRQDKTLGSLIHSRCFIRFGHICVYETR